MRITPFLIAALAAAGILAAGAGFCWQTRRALFAHMRQSAIESPDLTAEQKREVLKRIDAGQPAEVGFEMPESMMLRVNLSEIFAAYWHLWGMIVVTLCFGAACLFSWATSTPQGPAIESRANGGDQP